MKTTFLLSVAKPETVTVTETTSSTTTVSFQQSEPTDKVEVTVKDTATGETRTFTTTPNGDGTVSIDELDPESSYTVTLRSVTSDGRKSDPSEEISVTTRKFFCMFRNI